MFTSGKGLTAGWPVQNRYANRHGGTKNAQRRRETGRADDIRSGERAGMLFSRADQIVMLITGKMPIRRFCNSLKPVV